MKFITMRWIAILFLMATGLTGCFKDSCTSTKLYKVYTPIYKQMDEVRELVEVSQPREMESTGKIFIRGEYLFVNEKGVGVHVVNISNPASPVQESFLTIPGNVDMATNGNYLYCDNFIDLVVFDISNMSSISLAGREENVFPLNVSINENAGFWEVDTSKGVAIDWTEEEIEVDCSNSSIFEDDRVFVSMDSPAPIENGGGRGSGIGGSMAQFTVMSNTLYVIDESGTMTLFDLSVGNDPSRQEDVFIGNNIETIFPYRRGESEFLFIGAADGMYIYNNDDPLSPTFESNFLHVESCDPVVAKNDDTIAYVTLRSGTTCGGFTDELQLVNISDLKAPSLISRYNMHNPHGLGVDNDLLFICDGSDGLKVFDISESLEDVDQKQIVHFDDFFAYDVIPYDGLLVVSSDDGFHLISYSDKGRIEEVGSIASKR